MSISASDGFFGCVALIWFAQTLRSLRDIAAVPALPRLALDPKTPRPLVSVVFSARDEAPRIETTVRRILAQSDVDLEVIAVDDRSSDGTRAVLEPLARDDRRVTALRVDALPDGWLGKPHGCHVGAGVARAPWILFTDADTWLAPDVLRRALDVAQREDAAHVVVAPGVRDASPLARAALIAFKLSLVGPMARANRDSRRRAIGIGAFNLVRADAWRAVGGHERLRMEVIDDLRLGALLAQAGFRTRAFTCEDGITVDWARDLVGIVRALEKNAFAQMRYSAVVAFGATVLFVALWAGALIGPWIGSSAGWTAFAALFSMSIPSALLEARHGGRPAWAIVTPLLSILLVAAIVNSAVRTLAQGGVRWRGTLYRLSELRAARTR